MIRRISPSRQATGSYPPAMARAVMSSPNCRVSFSSLRALFRALAADGSPFSEAVVRKMRAFSFALIPVAVFSSAGETLAFAFLSAGRDGGICIQWGVAAAFLITLCLATVFRYGVQLQRESDETL